MTKQKKAKWPNKRKPNDQVKLSQMTKWSISLDTIGSPADAEKERNGAIRERALWLKRVFKTPDFG